MASPAPAVDEPVTLLPAGNFSIKELTIAYNLTRVDYMVPMPMNIARMTEYITVYDVDLGRSFVAMGGDEMLGLGMLGVRPGRAWITRLGVLPARRRRGTGEAVMRALLSAAEALAADFTMLEVIKGNEPAHNLFVKLGYYEVGELLILRRPPGPPSNTRPGKFQWVSGPEALRLLDSRQGLPPWTNQNESLRHAQDIFGLVLTLPDGSHGWMVFQRGRYILSRLVVQTERGDPAAVGGALLARLHDHYFDYDTRTENISADDPHLPAFYQVGYVEAFRRIEMYRGARPARDRASLDR